MTLANSFSNPFAMSPSYGAPYTQPIINQSQSTPMLPNMQMSQQAQQVQQMQASLLGRYITNADDIMPQEVSMGNAPSFFPLTDGSAIIAKQWANDGKINTVRYVAETPSDDVSDSVSSVSLADVMDTLSDMQDSIDSLRKSVEKKPANSRRTTAKKVEEKEADDGNAEA